MEGRQRRSFTDDYKRQAVDLVASSGRSIGSVAKELGLRDSVLRRWVGLRGAVWLVDYFSGVSDEVFTQTIRQYFDNWVVEFQELEQSFGSQ
jgi:hypothetical protein